MEQIFRDCSGVCLYKKIVLTKRKKLAPYVMHYCFDCCVSYNFLLVSPTPISCDKTKYKAFNVLRVFKTKIEQFHTLQVPPLEENGKKVSRYVQDTLLQSVIQKIGS